MSNTRRDTLILNPMKVFGLDLETFSNPYGYERKQGYEIISDEIEKHVSMYGRRPKRVVLSVEGCVVGGIPMSNALPIEYDKYY